MQGQHHALYALQGHHRDAIFGLTGVDAVDPLKFPRGPGRFKSVAKQVQLCCAPLRHTVLIVC
jgi:hypothetical protein